MLFWPENDKMYAFLKAKKPFLVRMDFKLLKKHIF